MKKLFNQNGEWHWFTGGLLVSLLSMITYFLFQALSYKDYPFGITAGIGYISALFRYIFPGLTTNPVIKNLSTDTAAFVEFFLLIGIVVGGYTGAKFSHQYQPEIIPAVWSKYHGANIWKRFAVVLIGGFLMGWGAILASGCTTGNILQGWAHLSLGSMVAGASFFVTGIITTKLLYRQMGGVK
ncbi:MAG: hypothetical protein COT43_08085 [Candidatus Marinimicrobia bacterium CG08_land_8_20_14_0_20_45_22]|nr:MAG: hypothetical protein COT43_08085 [Candidatus Marinimicrobia bacterium CG08_land_8_20_14_0_20_45_22]